MPGCGLDIGWFVAPKTEVKTTKGIGGSTLRFVRSRHVDDNRLGEDLHTALGREEPLTDPGS